ncbi:hypothetical protein KP509_09G009600 [Ceratopteris richardii]|nr:hypothetical protein KP509_09G009600 [Ceratopteris richardii]
MSEEEEDNDGGHPSPHLPDDSDNPQDDGKLMVGGRQIFCFSAPNKVNMNDVDNPVAHYAEDMDHHEDDDRSSRGRHVVCPPAPKKLRKSRPAYMGSTLVQKRSFFVPSDLHTLPDFLRALFFP